MRGNKLERLIRAMEVLKPRLPQIVGEVAIAHFKDSFRRQGWEGARFEPWAQRKRRKKDTGRAILIKTGKLRRSLHISSSGSTWVRIGSGLPYAAVHNEGLRAGRGKGFMMPRRQFAGHSPKLDAKIEKTLLKHFKSYL